MKIILMAAMTADGNIGKDAKHLSLDWTSHADKKLFVQITKQAGVIIMGRTTYDTIGRPLPKRLNIILTSSPEHYTSQPGIIEFHRKSPQEIIEYLKSKGHTQAVLCGGAHTYAQFLQAGLVEELYLTLEPKLFGNGVGLLGDLLTDIDLELISSESIGENSLFIKYQIIK